MKFRLKIRKIRTSLPEQVISKSKTIYFDIETRHWIAVNEEMYAGKTRPMVAVFDRSNGDIKVITIFPSDKKEIESRIKRGRWIYEKIKN